jgi:phytoene/squalene synthetase
MQKVLQIQDVGADFVPASRSYFPWTCENVMYILVP